MSDNDLYLEQIYTPYYKLDTGLIYDKDRMIFVTENTDADYKQFVANGGVAISNGANGYTKEQLIKNVLEFYGWDVGECLLTLDDLKSKRLSQLAEASARFEDNLNKDMYFTSSLGFKCNGDRRTRSNLEDLITYFDTQATGEPKQVAYMDYDNKVQMLSKDNLQTLLNEHVGNGLALYKQKWDLQNSIVSANSIENLNKIKIEFKMANYSKKV